jgi:large subunit ribosomal protein L19e
MNLTNQRRMAAQLLKCGENRIWIDPDPDNMKQVADCITRADVRLAINWGLIQARQKKGQSSGRIKHALAQKKKGRQRGPGSRKGAKYARTPRKREWIRRIRPIRFRLKELKDEGVIDNRTYRQFYMQAKGGMFKNKAHLITQLKLQGHLQEEPKAVPTPISQEAK